METRSQYSALIGPQGGGGEAAGAGQRGEATQDGAQAEVQGGTLHILEGAAIEVLLEAAGI